MVFGEAVGVQGAPVVALAGGGGVEVVDPGGEFASAVCCGVVAQTGQQGEGGGGLLAGSGPGQQSCCDRADPQGIQPQAAAVGSAVPIVVLVGENHILGAVRHARR